MKVHGLLCPRCGGNQIRRARYRGKSEALRALLGVYPFRCTDCGTRFLEGVLLLKRLWYAKCPRCLRTDLATWSRRAYQATPWQSVQLYFGAQRCRCTACRCNFVSFKPILGQVPESSDAEETADESA